VTSKERAEQVADWRSFDHEQNVRYLTAQFLQVQVEVRERCAAKVEEQGRLLRNILEDMRHEALISDLARSIRNLEIK
jgi:hypothetical protein